MSSYHADQRPALRGPVKTLLESLRLILPCIYCRTSQNTFLDDLGMPQDEHFFEWSQRLHSKVNSKLELQRIEKLRKIAADNGQTLSDDAWTFFQLQSSRNVLFSEPSMEVLLKRVLVHGDNPWTEMDALTILVVLNLYAQGKNNTRLNSGRRNLSGGEATAVSPEVVDGIFVFTKALRQIHLLLEAPRDLIQLFDRLIETPNVTDRVSLIARRMYPGHSDSDIIERLKLFHAGACISGTCV